MGGSINGNFGRTLGQKTTKHGDERLKERGFTKEDISRIKNTTNIKKQRDGAKVYIKENSQGRFDIIIEGSKGIITALKNISQKSLDRLMKNYDWR